MVSLLFSPSYAAGEAEAYLCDADAGEVITLPATEDAYAAAQEPKELVIVPGADHVDLYDNFDKIPFDKLETFFKNNL